MERKIVNLFRLQRLTLNLHTSIRRVPNKSSALRGFFYACYLFRLSCQYRRLYRYKAYYWWYRYRCNNIYNNFLADYFPNFWRAERKYLKGIVYRYRLHKKIGIFFRLFTTVKRSDMLFHNVNVYLNLNEFYSLKSYYLKKYLQKQ